MSTQNLDSWIIEALELMVHDRVSTLFQAAALLGREESPQACAAIERRKAFRELRGTMTQAYYASKGGAQDTDKTVLVGSMLDDAQRLRAMGKPKEAAEVVAQAAKILGYTGADTNVNLFADLSGADLQRALVKVREHRGAETPAKPN